MANWEFLEDHRVKRGPMASSVTDGFNGAFMFAVPGEARCVCCVASDGAGWQHVSVSFGPNKKTPSWAVMCAVKDLFWDEDQVVIQLHPARSQWVNNHPGCLHMWRCTDGREQPVPPAIMVGFKDLNPEACERMFAR